MVNLNPLYKKANEFHKLQQELPVIIELSNIPKRYIFRRCNMAETKFYKRMKEKNFSAADFVKIFTAIVEIQNLQAAKNAANKE